jgi:hypothetical protein
MYWRLQSMGIMSKWCCGKTAPIACTIRLEHLTTFFTAVFARAQRR